MSTNPNDKPLAFTFDGKRLVICVDTDIAPSVSIEKDGVLMDIGRLIQALEISPRHRPVKKEPSIATLSLETMVDEQPQQVRRSVSFHSPLPTNNKCEATTSRGTRCRREKMRGGTTIYCKQHRDIHAL